MGKIAKYINSKCWQEIGDTVWLKKYPMKILKILLYLS